MAKGKNGGGNGIKNSHLIGAGKVTKLEKKSNGDPNWAKFAQDVKKKPVNKIKQTAKPVSAKNSKVANKLKNVKANLKATTSQTPPKKAVNNPVKSPTSKSTKIKPNIKKGIQKLASKMANTPAKNTKPKIKGLSKFKASIGKAKLTKSKAPTKKPPSKGR